MFQLVRIAFLVGTLMVATITVASSGATLVAAAAIQSCAACVEICTKKNLQMHDRWSELALPEFGHDVSEALQTVQPVHLAAAAAGSTETEGARAPMRMTVKAAVVLGIFALAGADEASADACRQDCNVVCSTAHRLCGMSGGNTVTNELKCARQLRNCRRACVTRNSRCIKMKLRQTLFGLPPETPKALASHRAKVT